jgi:hypothetical protein
MQLMNRLVPVALTLLPVAAAAQTTGVLATKRPMTWGIIFALLFLMLGPIKLLGPFAAATKNSDRVFRFRLATRAFLLAIGFIGSFFESLIGGIGPYSAAMCSRAADPGLSCFSVAACSALGRDPGPTRSRMA